jgi:hypothetical protein
MLTGRQAFGGDTVTDILGNIVRVDISHSSQCRMASAGCGFDRWVPLRFGRCPEPKVWVPFLFGHRTAGLSVFSFKEG